MSTQTPNYGLIKPTYPESADVEIINGNMDIIDAQMYQNAQDIQENAEAIANIYPVGSIYMSTSATSPASIFGGTWEQMKDKFLLGAGDTYTAGTTGGSADAVIVSHNHDFTIAGENTHYAIASAGGTSGDYAMTYGRANSGRQTARPSTTGVDGTGKNMPPYLAVYMWKRVA